MTLSILMLRPVYFMLAAFIEYLDALDSALGIILILIGAKLCLGQAGFEVPLWMFAGILTAWRVVVAAYVVFKGLRREPVSSSESAPIQSDM